MRERALFLVVDITKSLQLKLLFMHIFVARVEFQASALLLFTVMTDGLGCDSTLLLRAKVEITSCELLVIVLSFNLDGSKMLEWII